MKTVFLNPFLSTDLNEKVTFVSFKIGSFDYIAKHADVKTTEIDFDKRIIQINDALDSTASLRELVCVYNFKISTLCKKILLQQLRIPEVETGLLM